MCGCPEFVPRYHPGALLCVCGHSQRDHGPLLDDAGRVQVRHAVYVRGTRLDGPCTRVADTA